MAGHNRGEGVREEGGREGVPVVVAVTGRGSGSVGSVDSQVKLRLSENQIQIFHLALNPPISHAGHVRRVWKNGECVSRFFGGHVPELSAAKLGSTSITLIDSLTRNFTVHALGICRRSPGLEDAPGTRIIPLVLSPSD